ncbi:MAG TPA: biliverdin-producing heme oxygenase [Hansschlegelia sp.]
METLDLVSHVDSLCNRLKAATAAAHKRVDLAIMAGRPFESRERYGLFLRVQHAFHRDIDALYRDEALGRALPGLPKRARLRLIEQDLDDLAIGEVLSETTPVFEAGAQVDMPVAIGWLYVSEGSNLGAAFLLKAAAKLGLSESFGARHLAAAPEGRGLSWKTFATALDDLALGLEETRRAERAADAAFARVSGLVARAFD